MGVRRELDVRGSRALAARAGGTSWPRRSARSRFSWCGAPAATCGPSPTCASTGRACSWTARATAAAHCLRIPRLDLRTRRAAHRHPSPEPVRHAAGPVAAGPHRVASRHLGGARLRQRQRRRARVGRLPRGYSRAAGRPRHRRHGTRRISRRSDRGQLEAGDGQRHLRLPPLNRPRGVDRRAGGSRRPRRVRRGNHRGGSRSLEGFRTAARAPPRPGGEGCSGLAGLLRVPQPPRDRLPHRRRHRHVVDPDEPHHHAGPDTQPLA